MVGTSSSLGRGGDFLYLPPLPVAYLSSKLILLQETTKTNNMGKLTEYFDYLTQSPKMMDKRYRDFNYFHIDIGAEEKKLRRELKLYKK